MDISKQARADRLVRARKAAGFELPSDAANKFGWTKPTYYGHENGHRGFSYATARKYARAFGVDAEWLWSGTSSKLTPRERAVLDSLRTLDPDQREKMEEAIIALGKAQTRVA